jgi:hypothetical protein
MRGKNLFKKTDMRRAIDTARKAGLAIGRINITKDGISIVVAKDGVAPTGADLDNWLAKEGKGARPA